MRRLTQVIERDSIFIKDTKWCLISHVRYHFIFAEGVFIVNDFRTK